MKFTVLLLLTLLVSCAPKSKEWPRVWMSYRTREITDTTPEDSIRHLLERDFKDMADHEVDLVSIRTINKTYAALALEIAKKHKLLVGIRIGDDPDVEMVEAAGLKPDYAQMIGGVYRGKAVDRHLFEFSASKHEIIVEPPVYNGGFAYIDRGTGLPVGHYYPGMGDPVKAEIIVPLQPFDGRQHLAIISAGIERVSGDTPLTNDSATPEMHQNTEIINRNLYRISFDLSDYGGAMLDSIGIALYWEYHGYSGTWYMFSHGPVSACSETTKEAIRIDVRSQIDFWRKANQGTFPSEQLFAGRWGDENFYLTGHLNNQSLAVNYPVYDYSEPFIREFRNRSTQEHPRTWGFPEIYGEEAYGLWRYLLHARCAELVEVVKEEVKKVDNEFYIYRNLTRNGAFDLPNEFDGSGPELLTRHFDVVHLDPYVVHVDGYRDNILVDMGYYSGLARRYDKPMVPWVQAITDLGTLKNRGSMRHPTPELLVRMIDEHRWAGVDGIMWLGYGPGRYTFPAGNRDTWKRARKIHYELKENPPPRPKVQLAAVRPYTSRSLVSNENRMIRNPADYYLELFLRVWSVDFRQHYDVFEIPPDLSAQDVDVLKAEIDAYPHVVSSKEWGNALVVGKELDQRYLDPEHEDELMVAFRNQIQSLGWVNKH